MFLCMFSFVCIFLGIYFPIFLNFGSSSDPRAVSSFENEVKRTLESLCSPLQLGDIGQVT